MDNRGRPFAALRKMVGSALQIPSPPAGDSWQSAMELESPLCLQEITGMGSMNLLVLILRLLFGPLPSPWNEVVPLAVRRDGQLQSRLQPEVEPAGPRKQAGGPWSLVWNSLLRAVGWVRRRWQCRGPGHVSR